MKTSKTALSVLIALLIIMSFSGCASVGVDLVDRDILSRPEMQFDNRANDMAIDEHIYFSKEASSGGRGFGGGGCGCN